MECNKDEATRAKEIAEKKFNAKDIIGAKKFALKAQNLYPGLEGIPQMLATLDVHIYAENRVNGEADWYGILGVNPQANDETVKKQYRKLALMLHPDKNKSAGAEGAFKLISQAWSFLSDKGRKIAYDQKRNAKVFQNVWTPPSGGPSPSPAVNGFNNFTKCTASNARAHKSTTQPRTSSAPASSHTKKPNTFWTLCRKCYMQYEYLRVYLNQNLLCPDCRKPFLAVETAAPPGSKPSTPWNFSKLQKSNHQAATKNASHPGRNHVASSNVGAGGFSTPNSHNTSSFQWGQFSRTGPDSHNIPSFQCGTFSTTGGASTAAQAASVVQQTNEKVKREREEEVQTATKRRRGMDDVSVSNHGRDASNQMDMGTSGGGTAGLSGFKQGNFEKGKVNGISKPNGTRGISQLEIQNLLMGKAKEEIRKKLCEWKLATITKNAVNTEGSNNEKANEKGENSLVNGDTLDQNKSSESAGTKNVVHDVKAFPGTPVDNSRAETLETVSINVPDPDFHDFDKGRTEMSFEDNQVWAAYDNDGMPRFYAVIHNVISSNPFKMRISWLNSKTNSELGPVNWVGSGFTKTCGDFRVGKYEINNSLNSFSHKVEWTKGTRGVISIYPRKGDVWALYRNWSPNWNERTADEVVHKYDMVEVLEDYIEELGVTVAPLVKVAGFKTVFHRNLDPKEVQRIPRKEMFRFSHHVPAYLLTGQEGPNAPKGCLELDPAATPLEHLQVIVDAKEEEIGVSEERVKEANVVSNIGKANDIGEVNNPENARGENPDTEDIQEVGIPMVENPENARGENPDTKHIQEVGIVASTEESNKDMTMELEEGNKDVTMELDDEQPDQPVTWIDWNDMYNLF